MSLNDTKTKAQIYFEKLFPNKEIEWKYIYLTSHRVTIDTNLRIFQYKILNNVLYLNENFSNSKLFLHLCSFCNSENETPIHFFTLAIKQNLFGINYESYWTQKYFFPKIRHRVISLVFQIIKNVLKNIIH